jgi:hypothetical protein
MKKHLAGYRKSILNERVLFYLWPAKVGFNFTLGYSSPEP